MSARDDSQPDSRPHLVWIYVGSLANTLDAATWLESTRELKQLGWRVTLVGTGPAGWQSIRGVKVFCISRSDVYLLRQLIYHLKCLWFILKQWNSIDVLLFHQMSAVWFLPLRLIRNLKSKSRPLLVMDTRTIHMEPLNKEGWKARLRRAFNNFMNRMANRWADGQTAITHHMARAVNIPTAQLWGVWPSGVRVEQFINAHHARRWPENNEPVRLVYIGSLHYERNLMALCRAVAQANTEGLCFNLTLIGEGTEREDLEKFAAQTAGQICVLPPVSHEQVWKILADSHIGTLPFPDEEKFRVSSPIKLFEYMAAGLPIMATHIVCHTDVIGDGAYAFWAKDGSSQELLATLRLIWHRRESLSHMGAQLTLTAQAWTWRESAKKLKAALEYGLETSIRCTSVSLKESCSK